VETVSANSSAEPAPPATAAIVLAAGQGKRMRSDLPKVLHKVCGAPMVEFPLRALERAGIARKVVVLGVGREKVEPVVKAYAGVEVAHQSEPLGTGHAVMAARERLGGFEGPVLVLPGDAPCITAGLLGTLAKGLVESGADAIVVTAEAPDPTGYGRVVRDEAGAVRRIVEEKDATAEERAVREINTSVYAFRGAALWPLLDELKPENKAGEYYLTDVVRLLCERGARVATVAADYWQCEGVNDRFQLAQAAQVLRMRELERLAREVGVTVMDPASTFVEVDVEVGRDTIIEPFTVIRRGAKIGAGCHVGPFAHISDGAILEDGAEIGNFVEVKRSRIRKKAKAKHLAYIGDGDVGERANIGAGTIFCNYDGKTKSKTVVGEKAFIGSGSLLVAPAEIGPGATTGAGAVVTRGKTVPAGETWVGIPARAIKKATPASSATSTSTNDHGTAGHERAGGKT
jgi:bifunctional UDP-N-acetylglucosamine pyrophosphorylase/glucosamine-1-phosphate N-acetyltransferase